MLVPKTQLLDKEAVTLNKKVLFLTLHIFSLTGGIEKVCRSFSKVLKDFCSEGKIGSYRILSMYDQQVDLNYTCEKSFKGFNANRFNFAFQALKNGIESDVVILSHINLLIFGWIIKKISPKKRIILIAHGTEIWIKLNSWKTNFIRKHIEIIAVSQYTSQKISEVHQVLSSKIKILNNCLDPFFQVPLSFEKPKKLMKRYNFGKDAQILFTLGRLSSAEQYKGYDKVIEILDELPEHIHYLLSGNADDEEYERLNKLIIEKHLQRRVTLTGFIADVEIIDHYLLADIFIMPSRGEGFGISFIEAAACGRRSITGNNDGSNDAILNGVLGQSVNPNDRSKLKQIIINELKLTGCDVKGLQEKCLAAFGYETYKVKVLEFL